VKPGSPLAGLLHGYGLVASAKPIHPGLPLWQLIEIALQRISHTVTIANMSRCHSPNSDRDTSGRAKTMPDQFADAMREYLRAKVEQRAPEGRDALWRAHIL
jgi:hypothetical protein